MASQCPKAPLLRAGEGHGPSPCWRGQPARAGGGTGVRESMALHCAVREPDYGFMALQCAHGHSGHQRGIVSMNPQRILSILLILSKKRPIGRTERTGSCSGRSSTHPSNAHDSSAAAAPLRLLPRSMAGPSPIAHPSSVFLVCSVDDRLPNQLRPYACCRDPWRGHHQSRIPPRCSRCPRCPRWMIVSPISCAPTPAAAIHGGAITNRASLLSVLGVLGG
jgi:hypothetical protein